MDDNGMYRGKQILDLAAKKEQKAAKAKAKKEALSGQR
jgi:hypothetical protein